VSTRPDVPKNYAIGYRDFLRRWESREEKYDCEVRITRGLDGNINLTGGSDCCSSYLLTRWHPSFLDSLEPGVKELVERLIETWDCATYSSCEGHRSTKTDTMRIRNVRMGTRSRREHAKLVARVGLLSENVNRSLDMGGILLECRESSLDLEEGFEAPSVDLLFSPQTNYEDVYWREIETVYRKALASIADVDQELENRNH
jgi:hypothetical protein